MRRSFTRCVLVFKLLILVLIVWGHGSCCLTTVGENLSDVSQEEVFAEV